MSGGLAVFTVRSGSMAPTLHAGDRILVVDSRRAQSHIYRGEVVVLRRVPADPMLQDSELVERVIGMPGETISSRADTIYINGRPLATPWLPNLVGVVAGPGKQPCAQRDLNIQRTHIPAGHYFVMGDCQEISYDSRYWGTVPASYIVGEVFDVFIRNGHLLTSPIPVSTLVG